MAKQKKQIKKLDPNSEKIDCEEALFAVGIDPATHAIIQKKIKCFIKIRPPAYWIEIKLESGRKHTVTPDHNVLHIVDAGFQHTEAQRVTVGMQIPVENGESYRIEKVAGIKKFSENKDAYCLDIETPKNDLIEKNILLSNGIFSIRCDGDEDSCMLLMDALLNFSRRYLDEKRGGTMDAPLVLTPGIDPREVDDEVHGLELVSSYPLEFYHAAQAYKMPNEVKLRLVKHTLGTPAQFDPFPLTHPHASLHEANLRTRYVQLQSIPEKLEVQFALQDRLRAVDQRNAAQRLMESHFIPDLYGNLRSYSRQTFRCVECNESHRRPPLAGKCLRCGGNLLLTINKGGIEKYLQISKQIVQRYNLPEYTRQLIELAEREIKSIFEDDKEKQTGLADFV